MKYLIAIDSDGTLRHSDGNISDKTKKIIKKVVDCGNIVVICTARPRYYTLKVSNEIGLNEYLTLGHGEADRGGKYRKAIVADIFESFMGAMYLDLGFEEVKKFIYKYIIPIIEDKTVDFFDDYKSVLQELVQTDKKSLEYDVIDEQGPAHDKTFTVEVKIDNIVYGKGIAHSKKEAEQKAAHDALMKAQNGNSKYDL